MPAIRKKQRSRKLKAGWRDTRLLLREFAFPLGIFIFTIFGGGIVYYFLAQIAGEPISTPLESMYLVLSMTFLQVGGKFPQTWYLGLFYFIMPIVGLIILAQGVTEFSVMLFNRRARAKEWEVAVASTYNNHIILVGLGHLGFRVAEELINMEQEIVIIEANPKADLINSIKAKGIPVIQDDATREQVAALPRGAPCTLHRDLHTANVLVDGAAAVFIDLDNLTLGDPAYDLAMLGTRLILGALLGDVPLEGAGKMVEGLPGAYRAAGGVPIPDGLYAWYVAANLAGRQAKTCVRHHAPGMEVIVPRLLALAARTLEQGRFDPSLLD